MNREWILRSASAIACIAGTMFRAAAQTVVFDAGPPQTVWDVANQQSTLLGLSSGDLISLTFPQRWLASPFTLNDATHVSEIDVYGFDPDDTSNMGLIVGFTNFHYIVWRRGPNSPAPLPGDQVATGTVAAATVGPGRADPRSGYLNPVLFSIPVDVDLPAGDYSLTVYAGEPTTPGTDANFGWFMNAQRDMSFSPPNTPIVLSDAGGPFAWRCTAFPTPGFQQYRTTAFLIDPNPVTGPDPQDPQYLYNVGFYIVSGSTGPACYPNCDGSTIPPVLNVNDFICFQTRFAAGDSYANCDGSTIPPVLNVNDFICFQTRFAAGCSAP
jgi:hypothetical protein